MTQLLISCTEILFLKIWLQVWLAWNNSPSYKHRTYLLLGNGFIWGLSLPHYKSMQNLAALLHHRIQWFVFGLPNRCKFWKCFYTIEFSGLYSVDYKFYKRAA
jgi:hypothetical protein